MSTRSVVFMSSKKGEFKNGVYIHFDGYPEYTGVRLKMIANKPNASEMIDTLKSHNWDCLTDEPDDFGGEFVEGIGICYGSDSPLINTIREASEYMAEYVYEIVPSDDGYDVFGYKLKGGISSDPYELFPMEVEIPDEED